MSGRCWKRAARRYARSAVSPMTRRARWLPHAQRPIASRECRSHRWCGRQKACRCWWRSYWPLATWVGSRHGSRTRCARGWPGWMPASGRWWAPRQYSAASLTGGCWNRPRESRRKDVTEALHRCTALQLVVTDGPGFAFRHALTRDVILAGLAGPERCRLSLAAAEALASAAGDHDDGQVLMTARLLADGGEPLRAAQILLNAGRRAFAVASLSSAELFLREAAAVAGSSEDLRAEVECQLAQVLLHAGQPSEAAAVASRMVTVTDGRDPGAATAMRLVLARAAVMTAAWDNARTQLADVRRGQPPIRRSTRKPRSSRPRWLWVTAGPVPGPGGAPRGSGSRHRAGRKQARLGLRGAGGPRVVRTAA